MASPIVAEQGGSAAYQKLGRLLQGANLSGVTLEDMSLFDPNSAQFQSLFSQAKSSSRLAAGPEWDEFEDAIFYRLTSASVTGELTCDVSSKALSQFCEAERKHSNLPALLVTLEGRRVTLRFHPQHGTLGGIENIKLAFAIALHRPEARPDCQVRWLT